MDYINRLKKLRLEKGISQEKCSHDTGISISSIKRYERHGIVGNSYNLKLLAEYFCVEMDYIYESNNSTRKEGSKDGITGTRNNPRNG